MSMIDTLRGRDQDRDVVLLHGVSYDYDLAWRDETQSEVGRQRGPSLHALPVDLDTARRLGRGRSPSRHLPGIGVGQT